MHQMVANLWSSSQDIFFSIQREFYDNEYEIMGMKLGEWIMGMKCWQWGDLPI